MRRIERTPIWRTAAALALLFSAPAAGRCDFVFPDFSTTTEFTTNGVAGFVGSAAAVTTAVTASAGSIWYDTPQTLQNGFRTTFEFNTNGAGGSGFAFVIQNDGTSALGATSAGLGYDGIANSLAVEFDLGLSNGGAQGDLNDNHVAVQSNGAGANNRNHLSTSTARIALSPLNLPVDFDDGSSHSVTIDYLPGLMEIYVDGNYIMGANVDLTNIGGDNLLDTNGAALVGFTAGNGSSVGAQQDVLSWSLKQISGASITTADNGADSYVHGGSATNQGTNFGGAGVVQIKNQAVGTGNPRKAYFRFDRNELGVDPLLIEKVSLELVVDSAFVGSCSGTAANSCPNVDFVFEVYGLNDGHAGENWDESSIVWGNAPASDTTSGAAILGAEATLLGQMAMTSQGVGGESLSFSTDELKQFLLDDADGVVTLIVNRIQAQEDLSGGTTVTHQFVTKEGSLASAPTLHVTVVPEPTSAGLALCGLAAMSLMVRRRRRVAA